MPRSNGKKKAGAPASLSQLRAAAARISSLGSSWTPSKSLSAQSSSSSLSLSQHTSVISPDSAAPPKGNNSGPQEVVTRSPAKVEQTRKKKPPKTAKTKGSRPKQLDQADKSIPQTTCIAQPGSQVVGKLGENIAETTTPIPPSSLRPTGMDNPTEDIERVVKGICSGTPEQQHATLMRYFLPDTALIHPAVRVPSFKAVEVPFLGTIDSRTVLVYVWKWYKIMTPNVDIHISSSAFDKHAGLLFLDMEQTVRFWYIPWHEMTIRLVVVLRLVPCRVAENGEIHLPKSHSPRISDGPGKIKYLIASQEDVFPAHELTKMFAPFANVVGPLYYGLQVLNSFLLVVLVFILTPFMYFVKQIGLYPEYQGYKGY